MASDGIVVAIVLVVIGLIAYARGPNIGDDGGALRSGVAVAEAEL
jgi:hypothetical protein